MMVHLLSLLHRATEAERLRAVADGLDLSINVFTPTFRDTVIFTAREAKTSPAPPPPNSRAAIEDLMTESLYIWLL